jgi:hypothetical protein
LLGTVWYGDSRQYTLPATGEYVIQVYDSGHNAAGDYNFTLQWTSPLKGCIAGQKFNDLDGDGVKEAGESGLQGWTVFLDANNNGTLDSGERRTVTDILGNYSLTSLGSGSYHVREVPQSGWQQTKPFTGLYYPAQPSKAYDLTLSTGQAVTGQDFGNTQTATISGLKWNDADGDGFIDGTEQRLSGWEIYLDTNNNGVWNSGEPKTATRSDGWYRFIGLAPGTYKVREVPQAGWVQTWPTSGYYTVTLGSGQWFWDGHFGNRESPPSGFTVTPTSGLVTTEGGGTAAFTVKLNSQPTANVSVGLSSSDTTEGTVSPISLTWTPSTWNVAQTVTVTGVDDTLVDGDIAYTIVTAPATSSDAKYNGLNPADVAVTNLDNDPPGGPRQIVSDTTASYAGAAGATVQFPVRYTTSDGDTTLTGLGLRMHFDSSKLVFQQVNNVLPTGFVQLQTPVDDTQNFDNDASTDKFMLVSWVDISGQWPNQVLPTKLFDASFTLQAGLAHGTTTAVNFSASSTAAGYDFESRPITVAVAACSLDVDGNCIADALTDGILILRYLFGFTGTSLVEGVLAPDATRTDPATIVQFLDGGRSTLLDPDASGTADALTDGILILRYLFGFRGQALVDGVLAPGATRTDPDEIAAFLDGFLPNCSQTLAEPGPTSSSASAGETLQSTEDQQAETLSHLSAASLSTTASPADADSDTSTFSDSVVIVTPMLLPDVAEDEAATGQRGTPLVAQRALLELVDEVQPETLPLLPRAVTELASGYPNRMMFDRVALEFDSLPLGKPVLNGSDLSNVQSDLDVFTAVLSEMRLVSAVKDVQDVEAEDGLISGMLEFGRWDLPMIEGVDELLASGKWLE